MTPPLRVRLCPIADRDHRKSLRSYAHVFHYRNTICVARAFAELPEHFRAGILLHEIGHLEIGDVYHSEAHADHFGSFASGVQIHRCDSLHGRDVEYVDRRELPKAREFLRERIRRYD